MFYHPTILPHDLLRLEIISPYYPVATFLINGSLLFLLFAVALIAAIHYQILQEGRFLRRANGAAYEAYQASTLRVTCLFAVCCTTSKEDAAVILRQS